MNDVITHLRTLMGEGDGTRPTDRSSWSRTSTWTSPWRPPTRPRTGASRAAGGRCWKPQNHRPAPP